MLKPERIATGVRAYSRRRVLELLAELLAKGSHEGSHVLSSSQIFEGLLAREQLGGTSLGKGIALPHSRVKDAQQIVGAFLQLTDGISFNAIDRVNVDLFFALVVPEQAVEEHLAIISHLARMFNDSELRQRLRKARDPETVHSIIIHW